MAASFDSLPRELLLDIMEKVDCPGDLCSLVVASSSCYRAFTQLHETIWSAVVKHDRAREILQHALAVLKVPADRKDLVLPFCRGTLELPFPSDLWELAALSRLHCRTSFFVQDFSNKAFQAMKGTKTKVELSAAERARFYQGFYLYELYCRLFPADIDGKRFPCSQFPYMHSGLFLNKLKDWKIEELACIHNYFLSLLKRYVREFEDNFIKAVMATPGVEILPGKTPRVYALPSMGQLEQPIFSTSCPRCCQPKDYLPTQGRQGNTDFKSLCGTRLTIFSAQARNNVQRPEQYLASCGVDFAYELVHGDWERRKEMIRSQTRTFWYSFADADSHMFSARCQRYSTTELRRIRDEERDVTGGYCELVKGRLAPDVEVRRYTSNELTRKAYVFWDMEKIKPRFSDILWRNIDYESISGWIMYDREIRGSVEARLDGVTVPPEEMRRLEDEFGAKYWL